MKTKSIRGSKSARELLRHLPDGYRVGFPQTDPGDEGKVVRAVGGANGHPYVITPHGKVLRDHKGMPLKVSTSPTARGFKNDLARVRRALRDAG